MEQISCDDEFSIKWNDNSRIKVSMCSHSCVQIVANRQGLIDLAKLLLSYANCDGSSEFHLYSRTSDKLFDGVLLPNALGSSE